MRFGLGPSRFDRRSAAWVVSACLLGIACREPMEHAAGRAEASASQPAPTQRATPPASPWGWFGLDADALPRGVRVDPGSTPPESAPLLEHRERRHQRGGYVDHTLRVGQRGEVRRSVVVHGADLGACRRVGQRVRGAAVALERSAIVGSLEARTLSAVRRELGSIRGSVVPFSKMPTAYPEIEISARAFRDGKPSVLAVDGPDRRRNPSAAKLLAWIIAINHAAPDAPRDLVEWALVDVDPGHTALGSSQVSLDGQRIGNAPLTNVCVRPGEHLVGFRGSPIHFELNVGPGEHLRVGPPAANHSH